MAKSATIRWRRPAQLKEHKQRFDIVIVEELPGRPCALRCKGCKDIISPANPSHQTAQRLMQAAHGARDGGAGPERGRIQPWQQA
eukprot:1148386-Pelagomonas_calceolata.AAC.2